VVGPQRGEADAERVAVGRLGLVVPAQLGQQHAEVVQALRRVRVAGAQALPADRGRAPVQRLRLARPPERAQRLGEVVQALRHQRVGRPEARLAQAQRLLVERQRLGWPPWACSTKPRLFAVAARRGSASRRPPATLWPARRLASASS
jgi:hypothetical protein